MIFGEDHSLARLKWAFQSCKNGAWGDEPDGESDAVCIRAADFNADLGALNGGERTLRSIDNATYRKVGLRTGDLIVEKSGGGEKQLVGRSVVYTGSERAVCSNFLARCRPSNLATSEYLNYLMLGIYKARGTYPHIKQTTGIQNLDMGSFLNTRVKLPRLVTQRRIAAFLDEKTAQIDALIARKRALLERLAEKRQAIITQAVTKGLGPTVPMKQSGMDWLGEIPAHWQVRPLKRMASIWGRIGFRGYTVNDIVSEGEGALSVSPSNIFGDRINFDAKTYISWEKYHESPEIKVRAGDILFVKNGSTIGKVCHVRERSEPMTVNPQVVVLKVHSAHSPFLSAAMSSIYFQHQVKGCIFGGSTPAMTQYNLGSLAVVTPPIKEQQTISDCLSAADDEYSTSKRKVERSIGLLSEYRSALITAAVTGQIEGLT